jgi:acyl carrier protein
MDHAGLLRDYHGVLRTCLPFSGTQPLIPGDTLTDLGLDSLTAVQLIGELEEAFKIEFPDELVTAQTFETVESLWLAVQGLLSAGGAMRN